MTRTRTVLTLAGMVALLGGCGAEHAQSSKKPKERAAAKPLPPCQVTARVPGLSTDSYGVFRATSLRPTVVGSAKPKDASVTVARSEFDRSGNGTGFQGRWAVAVRNGKFKYTLPTLKTPSAGFRFTAKAPGCRPGTDRFEIKHPPLTEAQKEAVRQKRQQQRIAREQRQAQRVQAYKASAQTIAYNQLDKNADELVGKRVKYTGQIFQIQERSGSTVVLLAVTNEGYGIWDDHIWVDIPREIRSAEDDIITVYGVVEGHKTYETQIGGETYVPQIKAKYVEE